MKVAPIHKCYLHYSPNRSLPDMRPHECAMSLYDFRSLGQASVIIIFTNEIWSTLIRTVWSVLTRTPKYLLKEIILVDDFSDKPELVLGLPVYIKHLIQDKVKLIRLPNRQGLIRARLTGNLLR